MLTPRENVFWDMNNESTYYSVRKARAKKIAEKRAFDARNNVLATPEPTTTGTTGSGGIGRGDLSLRYDTNDSGVGLTTTGGGVNGGGGASGAESGYGTPMRGIYIYIYIYIYICSIMLL